MRKPVLMLFFLCSSLVGCAFPPTQQELAGLPVVPFGAAVPEDGKFILHFPAGKPITSEVSMAGNLFQQVVSDKLVVKLNRDIYAWQEWVSFDQVTWQHHSDVLSLGVDVKLPGYTYPKPGYIRVRLNTKSTQTVGKK